MTLNRDDAVANNTRALAATSHIAPDAAAIQADEDNDQKRLALDSLGLGAFADFLAPSKVSPAIAPEASELAPIKTWQERAAGQELNGSTTFSAMKAEIADLRAAIAMHRAAAAKPDALDELVNSLSAEDRAECEKVRAELLAMPIERVINMVQGNLVAAEPVPTDLSIRLRGYAKGKYDGAIAYSTIMSQAADEIDRLTATKPAASEAVGVPKMGEVVYVRQIDLDSYPKSGRGFIASHTAEDEWCVPLYLAAPAAPTDAKPLPDTVQGFLERLSKTDGKVLAGDWVCEEAKALLAESSPQAPKTEGVSDEMREVWKYAHSIGKQDGDSDD